MVIPIAAADVVLVDDLPKRKVKKGILERLREFQDITNRSGGLVPFSVAATILGVSRQRVNDLVNEGTLIPTEAYGKKWLSGEQLKAFVQLKREPGRPWKEPSVKEMWKAARQAVADDRKDRTK